MSKTPNPTEGKLTEAEIENLFGWINDDPVYTDHAKELMRKLCDMALESLKAPAVTTGEGRKL